MFKLHGSVLRARQRHALVGIGAWLLAAVTMSSQAGWLESDNLLHSSMVAVNGEVKNAAVLRILPYVDQRAEKNHRLLGRNSTRVIGLTGNELLLDHDVADIVTLAMRNQFKKAGYAVPDADVPQPPNFELSGTIKRLSLNSLARDEVDVAIETNVRDLVTGKIIWSAVVSEKNDRYAGVAGNNKDDLVDYLNRSLRTVNGKTADAVGAMLMATYPALFNLTPGTQVIAGVQVHSAPLQIASPAMGASAPVVAMPVSAAVKTTGVLWVSSTPARAKVYVDDVYYGLSPLHLEMEGGVHLVMLKMQGRKGVSEKVSVRKGEVVELEISLAP